MSKWPEVNCSLSVVSDWSLSACLGGRGGRKSDSLDYTPVWRGTKGGD